VIYPNQSPGTSAFVPSRAEAVIVRHPTFATSIVESVPHFKYILANDQRSARFSLQANSWLFMNFRPLFGARVGHSEGVMDRVCVRLCYALLPEVPSISGPRSAGAEPARVACMLTASKPQTKPAREHTTHHIITACTSYLFRR
jgi:hypothetical protein